MPTYDSNRTRLRGLALSLCGLFIFSITDAALSLEPDPKEAEILKSCERRVCTMALTRKANGGDLKCALSKTWAKDTLKKGESKAVKWGFGDAKCTVNLNLSQADIIAALTKPEHTIEVPSHTVKCMVEREGEAKPVTARLAPKMQFKDGKADKIWINLAEVDGPATIKATVWTAANLEDSLGIFHKSMIKSVNKFLYQRCAKLYDANGKPKPEPGQPGVNIATPAAKPVKAKAAPAKPVEASAAGNSPAAKVAKPAESKKAPTETGSAPATQKATDTAADQANPSTPTEASSPPAEPAANP